MDYLRLRSVIAPAIAIAILLSVALTAVALADDHGPAKHPKYSSAITQMVEAAQSLPQGVPLTDDKLYTAKPPMDAYVTSGLVQLDGLGRLQAYVRISSTDADVQGALISAGAVVERQDDTGALLQVRSRSRTFPR